MTKKIEDIKKLPPEKRIEALEELEKELSEKHKHLIREAEELKETSAEELAIEEKLKEIKVPEAEPVNLKDLFKGETLEESIRKEPLPEPLKENQSQYQTDLHKEQATLAYDVSHKYYDSNDDSIANSALHHQANDETRNYQSAGDSIQEETSMSKKAGLYRR